MHENGVSTYMHVELRGMGIMPERGVRDGKHGFPSCETLGRVESAVDTFEGQIEGVYGRFSKGVWCFGEDMEMGIGTRARVCGERVVAGEL